MRLLMAGVELGEGFVSSGWIVIRIHPSASVRIGRNFRVNSGYSVNVVGSAQRVCIFVGRNARLDIGDDVGISNTVVVCMNQIEIGSGTLVGGGSTLIDSDLHVLPLGTLETATKSRPIRIEHNVFLGAHAIVLKGVVIGAQTVVGAGSVVRRSLPSGSVFTC
jgi:acetyltransferase-like isoleucine patch superfamily enzyme